MYNSIGCTLTTIPGVNVITAAKIVLGIGDVRRFPSASKLAQFATIASLKLSSADSETTKKRNEGKLITAWSKTNYDDNMKVIIKQLFGE